MFTETFNLWILAGIMHDGVATHSSRAVGDVLSDTHHERWMRREDQLRDATQAIFESSGFLIVGTLKKTLVAAAPVDKEESFYHLALHTCQTVRNDPGVFERMRWSMMGRV
jgi:hypothetical protein